MQTEKRFFNDSKYAVSVGILGVLVVALVLSIFLVAKTVRLFDNDLPYPNTITLTGKGEIVAIPDIATISYTVSETSETVETAQNLASTKNNAVIEGLKEKGIEEKDIKTLSYNIFPKYEWQQQVCALGQYCPGKNVLIGQEVSQTVQVKIRDTAKSGEVLSFVGSKSVANVSGLTFSVDDEDSVKTEARKLAIQDAKKQAEVLSEQLGVRLSEIVSFSEDNYPMPYDMYGMGGDREMFSAKSSVEPAIPTGESMITSRVYITFEVK